MNDFILKEKEEYWDNKITLKDYISRLKEYNYIDCSGNWEYEFHYIVENLEKLDKLRQENERLKQWDCIKDARNSRQRVANAELMKKIEQLKANIRTQKRRRKKQTHKKNIYKSRCEKATEYINERFTYEKDTGAYYLTHTFDGSNVFELLNILKGEKQ